MAVIAGARAFAVIAPAIGCACLTAGLVLRGDLATEAHDAGCGRRCGCRWRCDGRRGDGRRRAHFRHRRNEPGASADTRRSAPRRNDGRNRRDARGLRHNPLGKRRRSERHRDQRASHGSPREASANCAINEKKPSVHAHPPPILRRPGSERATSVPAPSPSAGLRGGARTRPWRSARGRPSPAAALACRAAGAPSRGRGSAR
jgi:hypothetical protein